MPKLTSVSVSDMRKGADRLHDILDGRIVLPEKLAVAAVGVLSATVPMGMLWLLYGVTR